MFRIAKIFAAVAMLVPPVHADHCRVQKQAVVVNQVAVPFVVPVGVVLPGSPLYSYRGVAQSYQQPQAASADPDYAEFLAWKAAKANQVKAAVVPQTLFAQNCAGCHTPGYTSAKQDAIDHLDASKELTSEQKLASIKAIMLGEMPRGKTLDPQVRADLIAELSGVKK